MQMWELLTVVTITAVIRCRYILGKLVIYLKQLTLNYIK